MFSKDTYDLKETINELFKSSEAKNSKDVSRIWMIKFIANYSLPILKIKQYTSSMVMRLQLAIQEVNGSIEDTSSQVILKFLLSAFRLLSNDWIFRL